MHRVFVLFGLAAGAAFSAQAQAPSATPPAQPAAATQQPEGPVGNINKLAARPPVTYDNRYEFYGGINLQNFQAGQTLPKRMNLGGVELLGTYWLTSKLGLGGQFRGEAGTTPVFPNTQNGRELVVLYEGLFGAQYRGPKSQFAAVNYHAYGGIAHGDFTETARQDENIGLYTNRNAPMFALGGSIDFNRSQEPRAASLARPDP